MGDGWETRRRREPGPDWVLFRLAGAGHVRHMVVDTSCFLGNAPAAAALRACDASETGLDAAQWSDLLPLMPLQPDTRHRFRAGPARSRAATHVRLEIHPDGGLARLRLFGELSAAGRARLGLRWFDTLPADQALAVLAGECGLSGEPAAQLAGRRPYLHPAELDLLLASGEFSGPGPAAGRVRSLILG
jgi:allantoicase